MTIELLLSQAIEGFLLARTADGYSPSTIAQYKWGLDRFLKHCGDKPIKEVVIQDMRLFMAFLQKDYIPSRPNKNHEPLSGSSIFAAWKSIRSFYKFLHSEFETPRIDFALPKPKFIPPVIEPYSEEEIKLLLKASEFIITKESDRRKPFMMRRQYADRDKSMILLMLDSGLRVSELCRLKVNDCDLSAGEIEIKPFRSSIKSRPRVLPIGVSTRKSIWKYLATRGQQVEKDEPLFANKYGEPLKRQDVLHMLKRLGKRVGITDCFPHKFRHTFAIMALRNGMSAFVLQKILGHKSLKMVQVYIQLSQADLNTAHAKSSPVDRMRLTSL